MEISQPEGVWAPALTAFTDRFEVDTGGTISRLHWLLQNGCNGVVVFGTTSEANSLSAVERLHFLDEAVSSGIDPGRILVGTGCCSLPDTADLTRQAVRLGCAGVLMLPPFYYKAVTDDGLFLYFAQLIDAIADDRVRIYLYHIPPISQVAFSLALIERLIRSFPQIVVGIKDSSGDWEHTKQLIERFAGSGFRIFPGSEKYLLPALQTGGKGCIAALANVASALLQEVYRSRQSSKADEYQAEVDRRSPIVRKYPLIPALKSIVAEETKEPAWRNVRPPLVPLSVEQGETLIGEWRQVIGER
jgi:4-hydroxy-tetrahydrodipicolinate synthase